MKSSTTLLIALACGTVATVFASQYLGGSGGGSGVATTEIYVAAAAIEVGEEITAEKIQLEQWPADKMPEGSTNSLDDISGKYAKQKFFAGEPLMAVKLMADNWSEVPRDYRVVATPASGSGIADLVQPGDRVDVTAYFDRGELFEIAQTRMVLKGVRVYALDGNTERKPIGERATDVRNIQLLIHQDDTEAWEMANQLGKIRLLASSGHEGDGEEDRGAGETFARWIRERQTALSETPRLGRGSRTPTAAVAPTPKPAKKGYMMEKLSGGRMIKYWIVPGEVPVMIGEVGEGPGEEAMAPSVSEGVVSPGNAEEEFSYLKGPNSPFFKSGR